jgi:hypothetical protein
MKRTPGMAFLIIGVAFLALGASGRRAFLGIGVAFFAIGVAFLARERRGRGPK